MKTIVQRIKDLAFKVRYGFRGAPLQMAGYAFRVDESLRRWNHDGESWMFDKMKEFLHAGDLFVDVGGNYGFHSLVGAHLVGDSGCVVAFEPLPENLEIFRRNCLLNECGKKIIIVDSAVSDVPGEFLEMGAADTGQDVTASIAVRDGHHRRISVANTSLDAYRLPEGLRCAMLKIDVEGAELSVLRSARDLLSGKRPVLLIEVHRDLLIGMGDSVEKLETYLAEFGYREIARNEVDGSMDHCYHALFRA
jgi:FkbM family methyltransferase